MFVFSWFVWCFVGVCRFVVGSLVLCRWFDVLVVSG